MQMNRKARFQRQIASLGLVAILVSGKSPFGPPLAVAQESLKAPSNWTGETITLPPGFAPEMTLRGVEQIRFAPGMFKAESADFFSYAFVFELNRKTVCSEKELEDEFLRYYRGLCKAVGGKRLPDLDTSQFTCDLKPSESPNSRGSNAFRGTLTWIEPFQTRKTQTLHMEIDVWSTAEESFIFACVSPAPSDAQIWKQLQKIRRDYMTAAGANASTDRRGDPQNTQPDAKP